MHEGVLDTYVAEDFRRGTAETLSVLHTDDGLDYAVHAATPAVRAALDALGSGHRVRALASPLTLTAADECAAPSTVTATDGALEVLTIESVDDPLHQKQQQRQHQQQRRREEGTKFGEPIFAMEARSVAVVLLSFRDVASAQCTAQDARDYVWGASGSVASYFRYATNTNVHFLSEDVPARPAVFGPYSVAVDVIRGCDTASWARQAEAQLAADGHNATAHDHVIYVIPSTQLCGWEGLGTLACRTGCRVWIQGCDDVGVAAHEIGHNFGLRHAGARIDDSEPFLEYRDPTSVMGNCWFGTGLVLAFNAPHMEQLDWVAADRVAVVAASGVHTLAPLDAFPELTAGRPQILKIAPRATPYVYYISFFGNLNFVLAHHMLVHKSRGPSAPSEYINSFEEGRTFRDISLRFAVQPLRINATAMVVSVVFGCAEGTADIAVLSRLPQSSTPYTVSAMSPLYLAPGTPTNITVVVRSSHAPTCLAASYRIDALSDRVAVVLEQPTVTVAAGDSCQVTAEVVLTTADSSSITFTLTQYRHDGGGNDTSSTSANSDGGGEVQVATAYVPVHPALGCFGLRPNISAFGTVDRLAVVVGSTATMALNVTNRMSQACGVQSLLFGLDVGTCHEIQHYMSVDTTTASLDYLQSAFPVVAVAVPAAETRLGGYSCAARFTASSGQTSTYYTVHVAVQQSCSALTLRSSFFLPPQIAAGQYLSSAYIVTTPDQHATCRYHINLTTRARQSPDLQIALSSSSMSVVDGIGSVRVLVAAKKTIATQNATVTIFSDATTVKVQQVAFLAAHCVREVPLFRPDCDAFAQGLEGNSYDSSSSTSSSSSTISVSSSSSTQDLSNNNNNNSSEGSSGSSNSTAAPYTFSCSILISNTDSADCNASLFTVQRPFMDTNFSASQDVFEALLLPGEWTRFTVEFSVSHADIPAPPDVSCIDADVFLADNETVPEHAVQGSVSVRLSQCVLGNIELGIDGSTAVFAFAENGLVAVNLTVTSTNSMHCSPVDYAVTVPDAWRPFLTVLPNHTLAMESGETRTVQLLVAPVVTAPLLVTVHSPDPRVAAATQPQSLTLSFVALACTLARPRLVFLRSAAQLPLGSSSVQAFDLEYTAMDSVTCAASVAALQLALPDGLDLVAWQLPDGQNTTSTNVSLAAAPGTKARMRVFVRPQDNVFPGAYTVVVSAALGDRVPDIAHVNASATITVLCSYVELPYNITTKQVTPFLATKPVFELTWRGCESAKLCCCPCTFSIYRNGLLVANTSERKYLDNYYVTVVCLPITLLFLPSYLSSLVTVCACGTAGREGGVLGACHQLEGALVRERLVHERVDGRGRAGGPRELRCRDCGDHRRRPAALLLYRAVHRAPAAPQRHPPPPAARAGARVCVRALPRALPARRARRRGHARHDARRRQPARDEPRPARVRGLRDVARAAAPGHDAEPPPRLLRAHARPAARAPPPRRQRQRRRRARVVPRQCARLRARQRRRRVPAPEQRARHRLGRPAPPGSQGRAALLSVCTPRLTTVVVVVVVVF